MCGVGVVGRSFGLAVSCAFCNEFMLMSVELLTRHCFVIDDHELNPN